MTEEQRRRLEIVIGNWARQTINCEALWIDSPAAAGLAVVDAGAPMPPPAPPETTEEAAQAKELSPSARLTAKQLLREGRIRKREDGTYEPTERGEKWQKS